MGSAAALGTAGVSRVACVVPPVPSLCPAWQSLHGECLECNWAMERTSPSQICTGNNALNATKQSLTTSRCRAHVNWRKYSRIRIKKDQGTHRHLVINYLQSMYNITLHQVPNTSNPFWMPIPISVLFTLSSHMKTPNFCNIWAHRDQLWRK